MKKRKVVIERTAEPDYGQLIPDQGIHRPNILFHYCPIEAFEAIISNSSMWLSDAACMNDKSEGKWINKITERISKTAEARKWLDSGHIISDYKLRKATFFINCFSEAGDLLSQWRAYADDGRGVSIGFSFLPNFLKGNLTLSQMYTRQGLGGHLERVVYDEKEQKQILAKIFRYVDYGTREMLNDVISLYSWDAIIDTGTDCLSYASRLMKHPGFSEEREWRIIYDGVTDLTFEGLDKKRQLRRKGNKEINYHIWKFQ